MADFLASILEAIHRLVGSYGWAIILFTLLIKLLFTIFTPSSSFEFGFSPFSG